MRAAIGLILCLLLPLVPLTSAQAEVAQNEMWPGDPIDNHVHMTWAAMTLEVKEWVDENPDIVKLEDVGKSRAGKSLWVVQLSDWSTEFKPNGSSKEIIYIDGGHHGNEYLGTALAWLSAKYYIDGWIEGNEEAIQVLQNSEVHVLIMLNPDGNDIDTRWNLGQVDLNRNYDHYWNSCPTTQPGTSAFSEPETLANSVYMNTVVPDADLYVTMHTGVWIILYPWGKWPEQPPDWELFHSIRDDVNGGISDIPIQNANQGLYPNCGTSRDYGYGVMGFPTFTFETDDEQFIPGSAEALNERLGEEMDVMRYLINNVWYWRARLDVQSITVDDDTLTLDIRNDGMASTANASLEYMSESGEVTWASPYFEVNATNSSVISFDVAKSTFDGDGMWNLNYQKRVINAATWVNETVEVNATFIDNEQDRFLIGYGLFNPISVLAAVIGVAAFANEAEARRTSEEDEDNERNATGEN